MIFSYKIWLFINVRIKVKPFFFTFVYSLSGCNYFFHTNTEYSINKTQNFIFSIFLYFSQSLYLIFMKIADVHYVTFKSPSPDITKSFACLHVDRNAINRSNSQLIEDFTLADEQKFGIALRESENTQNSHKKEDKRSRTVPLMRKRNGEWEKDGKVFRFSPVILFSSPVPSPFTLRAQPLYLLTFVAAQHFPLATLVRRRTLALPNVVILRASKSCDDARQLGEGEGWGMYGTWRDTDRVIRTGKELR